MNRPRIVRYLYNRWVFLCIGLAGLANIVLLMYRFAIRGLLSYAPEHVAAAVFSLITALLALAIFVDLTLHRPRGPS
jgi:hypothetical protein